MPKYLVSQHEMSATKYRVTADTPEEAIVIVLDGGADEEVCQLAGPDDTVCDVDMLSGVRIDQENLPVRLSADKLRELGVFLVGRKNNLVPSIAWIEEEKD